MRPLRMRRRQNDLQTRKRVRERRKRRRRRAAVRSGRLFETHGGQPPADHHVRGRRDGHQGETGRRVRRQPEETPRVHHGLRRQGAHGQGSGLRSHRQAAAVGLDRGGQPDHLLLLRLPSDRGGQIPRKGGEGHADGLRLQGLELRDPLPRRSRNGPRRGHRLRLALRPVERRDEEERREGHSGLRVLLRAQRQVEPQLLHLGDQLEPGLQRRTGGGGAGRLRDLSGRRAEHHRQGDRKQRLGHARDVQPRRQLPRRLRLLGLRNGLRMHHARGDGVVHGDRQRPFGRRRFQKDRQMDSLHGGYEQNGVQLLRLRAFEHRLPAAVVSPPTSSTTSRCCTAS